MYIIQCILVYEIVLFVLAISNKEELCSNSSVTRDFSEIVKSSFFVDKTLLIKELFCEVFSQSSTVPVVTVVAPPRFGKTVNINMVKTFLEVIVDEKGETQEVKSTSNYKLFKNQNLSIFRREIFEKHLGKYPVIFIDYSPLREVINFDHMIETFREILKSVFLEHNYLLSVESLWQDSFNKSSFEIYFDYKNYSKLHKYYIFCGFSILSQVLRAHFGSKVFVLMDDFDAIEDCPAYETGEDKRRIYNFVKEVYNDLLVDNENLVGALLVGTLREVKKEKKDYILKIPDKTTLSSTLWTYFGLSEEELKQLLQKFLKDERDLEAATDAIMTRFSGITNGVKYSQKHQPCSIRSVQEYLSAERMNDRIKDV